MKCPSCGKDNPDSAKFCGYCGAKMGAPEAVRPPEAPRSVPPPPSRASAMPPSAGASTPRPAPRQRQAPPPQQQVAPPQYASAPRARVGYPPPNQGQMHAPPADKSGQQRMIIIAAAVAVLIMVVICAVVAIWQRDTLVGIIDPAARETQMQADINMGLTQTAAVSVDVPATVQAQIAMTQTAVAASQPPAPQPAPQEAAPQGNAPAAPPAAPQTSADPAEAQYAQSVKDSITGYNDAMGKIQELLGQANTDANKLNDAQWKADFTAATAKVSQTSDTVRKLTAPQKFADVQTDMTTAATNLDNAVKLLSEYLNDKNQDKVSQAVTAKDTGNASLTSAQQKLTGLGF